MLYLITFVRSAGRDDFERILTAQTRYSGRSPIRFTAIIVPRPQSVPPPDYRVKTRHKPRFGSLVMPILRAAIVATLRLFKARSEGHFIASIDKVFGPNAIEVFTDELCAIWDKKKIFRAELIHRTLSGEQLTVIVSMPIPETEEGFKNVPVSILNITEAAKVTGELSQIMNSSPDFIFKKQD